MDASPWMILPFGVLLASIALAPLFFADWWARHYAKVVFSLTAVTLTCYLAGLHANETVLHTAVEYVGFIALIGSLYVVAGGIHISVKGEATPLANVVFLLMGAVVANLLGTTGASMLLIRPWLRMNKSRVTGHHVVFFILIVSNVGGCLTPIGDPPLFLGYLKGIPFWWVAEHCWPMWLTAVGLLLAMFLAVDVWNYRKAPKRTREKLAEPMDRWRFDGLENIFFLFVILGAFLIEHPRFLREVIMVAAAAGSYLTTRKSVHDSNHFSFHPIQEVAVLFIGIFATMMPALDYLGVKAGEIATTRPQLFSPAFFFWGSGSLSSVLDNAPTYLSFLKAIIGVFVDEPTIKQVQHLVQNGGSDLASASESVRQTYLALQKYHAADLAAGRVGLEEIEVACLLGHGVLNKFIVAISAGSVFFGGNTYIGNGPNFMVKAIADQQKVRTPSFLGYVFKFTVPFMIPMLVIVWWIFFR